MIEADDATDPSGRLATDISIVICTRDRARSLERTLKSLVRLEPVPDTTWEVVVVDNGSSDDTGAVIESFKDKLPVHGVAEPQAGLSNARNRGVSQATGRYIVWTDDDVEVDPGWLKAYRAAFDRWPDVTIFGGVATPILEQPTAPWFEANAHLLNDLLAIREFGTEPQVMALERGLVPFGLNYAVRTDVQRRYLYDPTLGVAPGRRLNGEEVDFFERALAAGFHGMCLPGPRVYHLIPPARQTPTYVRSYYESAGQTWVVMRPGKVGSAATRAILWTKFVIVRVAYTLLKRFPLPLRDSLMVRDAFHTGVVRQLSLTR